jgi:hypothetical protein
MSLRLIGPRLIGLVSASAEVLSTGLEEDAKFAIL